MSVVEAGPMQTGSVEHGNAASEHTTHAVWRDTVLMVMMTTSFSNFLNVY
jgi:hypothetical protein